MMSNRKLDGVGKFRGRLRAENKNNRNHKRLLMLRVLPSHICVEMHDADVGHPGFLGVPRYVEQQCEEQDWDQPQRRV